MSTVAVAWDVDGTLIDSEPLHLHALQAVCRIHDVSLADFGPEPFVGVAISDVWRILAPRFDGTLDELAFRVAINARYRADAHMLKARPGAVACVRRLHDRGVRQCAVSSSEREIVDINLQSLGLKHCFEFTVTLDDVDRAKPDPEPYRRAADRLGMKPESVWAVEDSASGLASACAAGLPTVLVVEDPETARGWGLAATRVHCNLHELGDEWPDVIAASPLEMP